MFNDEGVCRRGVAEVRGACQQFEDDVRRSVAEACCSVAKKVEADAEEVGVPRIK